MSQTKSPFDADDWGRKLDADAQDDPTLRLAAELSAWRPPAPPTPPAFKQRLRRQLWQQAEGAQTVKKNRFNQLVTAGFTVVILIGVALLGYAWLTQLRAAPENPALAPVNPARDEKATNDLPTPFPTTAPLLVDQAAPAAADYVRLIAVSPGPDTLLTGVHDFTLTLGYRLQSLPTANLRASLVNLENPTSASGRAAIAGLVLDTPLAAAADETIITVTGVWRVPEEAWMGPGPLQLWLTLADPDTSSGQLQFLMEQTVEEVSWFMEPRYQNVTPQLYPRLLWVDDCDPRQDAAFCQLSDSLAVLADFYGVIEELGATLDYQIPTAVDDLMGYDVVIANFCGNAGKAIPLIEQYIQAGGSVVVMGDSFCRGVAVGDQSGYTSAQAASLLSEPRGIFFRETNTVDQPWADVIAVHPITLGVDRLSVPGSDSLQVMPPSQAVAARSGEPFVAVYDDVGTVVVIPRVGFTWTQADAPQPANFILWRNMLVWLANMTQVKLGQMPAFLPAPYNTPLPPAPPTPTPWVTSDAPPVSGLISFVSYRQGSADIFTIDPATLETRQLTDNADNDVQPDWSPDGRQLVYTSRQDGNLEIVRMNADGSDPTVLAADPNEDASPHWAPDGQRIVFSSMRDGNFHIWTMTPDGADLQRLTQLDRPDQQPYWRPDGQIVFTRLSGSVAEPIVMNGNGQDVEPLEIVGLPATAQTLAWSPDMQWLAFTWMRDGQSDSDIYLMYRDGTQLTRLTYSTGMEAAPAWSPDGQYLAYVSDVDGNWEVYMMPAFSGDRTPTRLTHDPAADLEPAWGRAADN